MAEAVRSAVIQETVSQVLSGLVRKYEEKEGSSSSVHRNLERLEMAHIRLEAALETSYKWQITDASLLRWRRKLKRAAQECDVTLHRCKQRILEDEQTEQEVRSSSLPTRIVHATKSFVSSILHHRNNSESSGSVAQRFEWYADGASEFLRFVELGGGGGTPRHHMPFNNLVRNLLAGKELHHKFIVGNHGNNPSLIHLLLVPFSTEVYGTEATLVIIQHDGTPEGNIYFSITVELSESTDIVGIAIKCLLLFAPHFKCTVEKIRKGISQLLTEDLSWMPSVYSYSKFHVLGLSLGSQWLRPNPLCCKQHDRRRHEVQNTSSLDMAASGLSNNNVWLEPVLKLSLQCQVPLLSSSQDIISPEDPPYLRAGIFFSPHRSLEDMLPENRSSVIVAIVGEEQQRRLHTDITLEQLEEIILPGATGYFHQNAEATAYRIIWKSRHGTAHIQIEKEISMRNKRRTFGRARNKGQLMKRQQDQELASWARVISGLNDLWGVHAPANVRNTLGDWLQKEKERQLLAAPRLHA